MIIGGFDVETIKDQSLPFDPESVSLGNLKDPVKIAYKIAEAEVEFNAGEGQLSKAMATDPARCQVITFVGTLFDTSGVNPADTTNSFQWGINDNAWDNPEEYVVHHGWKFVIDCYNNRIPLVSFNGIGFDLPVMHFAAMRLDVSVPNVMYRALMNRWEGNLHHFDLMLMLTNWQKERMKGSNLDFFLRRFGIGQKTEGMDGSKVGPAFLAGKYQEILEYCKEDVLNTCKLFTRVAPWVVPAKE